MGHVYLNDDEITHKSIRYRNDHGLSHIPEDRHKHGLVLDYTLGENLILKSYYKKDFQNHGIINFDAMNTYADRLIEEYDVRSGEGRNSIVRGMSGGNQQKAIIAREVEQNDDHCHQYQQYKQFHLFLLQMKHHLKEVYLKS